MEENQAATPQEQKGSNPSLVIGIIVVIVVIAGAFWLMSNNKNQSAQTQQQTQTQTTQTTVTQEPTATGSESAEQGSVMTEKDITVEGGSFYFKPNEIKVKKGDKVKITLKNSGGMHNFVIDELNVKSETISSGTTTVAFTADKAGTFEFYCAIGNHRAMGMKGNLIVQ